MNNNFFLLIIRLSWKLNLLVILQNKEPPCWAMIQLTIGFEGTTVLTGFCKAATISLLLRRVHVYKLNDNKFLKMVSQTYLTILSLSTFKGGWFHYTCSEIINAHVSDHGQHPDFLVIGWFTY